MTSAEFPTFGFEHNMYLLASFIIWLGLPFIGRKYLSKQQKMTVAIVLIAVTLLQELLFDFFQLYIDDFDLGDDLSLHMCGLSLFISCYALYYKSQAAFEISFFWGIVGASQAIFTPDPARFPYGDISVFFNFLSHGIIILNVFWLMIVDGMRCRKGSLLNTFFIGSIPIRFCKSFSIFKRISFTTLFLDSSLFNISIVPHTLFCPKLKNGIIRRSNSFFTSI